MADSEKMEEKVQDETKSKAKATGKDKKKDAKKNGFFKGVKAEFKRVVWPDKDTIVKESTAVVVATVILGAIIALLDFGIKMGLDKIFS